MYKSFLDFFTCLWYSTHYLVARTETWIVPNVRAGLYYYESS
jgi:hypothetical protein